MSILRHAKMPRMDYINVYKMITKCLKCASIVPEGTICMSLGIVFIILGTEQNVSLNCLYNS
jgi:hypothetical protein